MIDETQDHQRTPANGGPDARPRHQLTQHLDVDVLNAYIDGTLNADERATAADHLATCADCRRELGDLRATVSLLGSLPQYRPRRSFQLGLEHAESAEPGWIERLLPALPAIRMATIAVAILLLAVGVGDVVTNRGEDPPAPATEEQPALRSAAPDAVSGTEAPDAASDLLEEAAPDEPEAADDAGAFMAEADEESEAESAPAAFAPAPTAEPAIAAPAEAGDRDAAAPPVSEEAASAERDRPSAWRIVEVGLAALLLWLLVSWVGLQRLRRRAGG